MRSDILIFIFPTKLLGQKFSYFRFSQNLFSKLNSAAKEVKTEERVFRYKNIFSFIVNQSADTAESSVFSHELSVPRGEELDCQLCAFIQCDNRVSTGGCPHHQSAPKQNTLPLRGVRLTCPIPKLPRFVPNFHVH